ncbi:MAG: hypothetical protein ACK5B9_05990 [Flavobacteriia bacterium]|jgi:hypothetical protein
MSREESMRIAAEKIRLKREREAREEKEMYERITSGWQWLLFKIVVAFCTIMFVLTTIEVLFDGPTKKLTEQSWKIDRNWEYDWHKVLDVEGYMFSPTINDWSDRVKNSLSMTYTPIFRTGKKLNFDIKLNEIMVKKHTEIRENSIFNWFPALQIFLLLPLFTFIFKRQKPWFNFARIASFVIVFPGTILVIFFSLM